MKYKMFRKYSSNASRGNGQPDLDKCYTPETLVIGIFSPKQIRNEPEWLYS